MNKIIFIAGGGTGGHLFPAISIGSQLTKNNFSVIYIGSKYGIEKEYFKKNSFTYYLLNIRGLQRTLSFRSLFINILLPFRFIVSYLLSMKIIKKHNPSAIIGTGGYASAIPLIVGSHLKIPIIIQEQNSIPGMITKKLSKKASKIFLGFESSKQILNSNNCIYTGNPIRNNLKILNKNNSKKKLGFDVNKKLILIIGGSQGAHPINNHILNNITFYINNNYQLLWQCGNYDYKNIKNKINNKFIKIENFIDDMSLAYSSSDLVISRAGAIAISELTYFKKAMILIPLPNAANNHQKINAIYFEKQKACIRINQEKLCKGDLEKSINNILNNSELLKKLESNSNLLSNPNATTQIINETINLIL